MARNSGIFAMSTQHKNILVSNRVYITDNVVWGDKFVGHMIQSRLVNEDMRQELQACSTSTNKISCLLDFLPKRGPDAFQRFINALVETQQDHVAKKLDTDLFLKMTMKDKCIIEDNGSELKPSSDNSKTKPINCDILPPIEESCASEGDSSKSSKQVSPTDSDEPEQERKANLLRYLSAPGQDERRNRQERCKTSAF